MISTNGTHWNYNKYDIIMKILKTIHTNRVIHTMTRKNTKQIDDLTSTHVKHENINNTTSSVSTNVTYGYGSSQTPYWYLFEIKPYNKKPILVSLNSFDTLADLYAKVQIEYCLNYADSPYDQLDIESANIESKRVIYELFLCNNDSSSGICPIPIDYSQTITEFIQYKHEYFRPFSSVSNNNIYSIYLIDNAYLENAQNVQLYNSVINYVYDVINDCFRSKNNKLL